jgi:inner membrane protein involved in colicin E2 resistance
MHQEGKYMNLHLALRIVRKYVKYNLIGGCCFLFATVLFFVMEGPVGTTWSWFIANFLAGGLVGFLVQLFLVYDDKDAKEIIRGRAL